MISEIELGARLLAEPDRSGSPARTGRRRRRRCSVRSSRPPAMPVEVAGNIGRPLTSLVGVASPRRVGRLRALVVPARGRRDAATAGRGAPQPRAGSPRPARRLRRLRRREAAHLREPGSRRRRGRAARVRRRSGRGAADRVRGRRPAAGRAADPRRAQPRERRRRDGRGAGGRRSGRRDRRGALQRSPASSTASRPSPTSAACATSTTRRRPTSPLRCARSRRSRSAGCT